MNTKVKGLVMFPTRSYHGGLTPLGAMHLSLHEGLQWDLIQETSNPNEVFLSLTRHKTDLIKKKKATKQK